MALVIFDMDGVLYRYDTQWRKEELARRCGLPVDEFARLWIDSGWEDEAEAGAYSSGASYLAAFNRLVGADMSLEDWVAVRKAAVQPNDDLLQIAASLAEKHDVVVLSNNAPLLKEHIDTIAPRLRAIFGEHIYVSAELKARKPDARAFLRLMARFGTGPAETVFIDDSAENAKGAAAIGIAAVCYRPDMDLREQEAIRRLLQNTAAP